MCGIAGIWHTDGRAVDEATLRRMIAVQRHRGPDGEGYHVAGAVGLGHARLKIIDLSPAAAQPMTNEDGSLWLTYNGEVYNYVELMAELRALGHTFRSRSDSEVILHAYEEWGERCVERFNGMWAFALWDERRRVLWCSRDRFGVKPFYYLWDGRTFACASEIKALLAFQPEARRPNYPYLLHFLTSGLFDDGSETAFAPVRSLPPAHALTVRDGALRLARHWDYDAAQRAAYDYGAPEATFRELLGDAVRLRLLRSDVPVGTCLSGGLDSSAIVALSSRLIDVPVRTFSAIYDEPEANEAPYVAVINERCRTLPHLVNPRPDDFMSIVPRIVWHQDEPTAGPGLYSQWHVMQRAHGVVTVLLDGQGSDELLGGYHHAFGPYLATVFRRAAGGDLPAWRRLAADAAAIAALAGRSQALAALKPYLPAPLRALYRTWRGTEASGDVHRDLRALVGDTAIQRQYARRFADPLDDALYWSVASTSIPGLLHYEDRNSMAFGLEARVPFLDYRLVEFCLGLPFDDKVRGATTKHIMRRALRGIVPDEVLDRRDKKGYPTPLARWLRGPLRAPAADLLLGSRLPQRGVLRPAVVERKLAAHAAGRHDYSWEIWRWLTLELWFTQFIDAFDPARWIHAPAGA
ncbi:MAG: asparagine synthase (glutamine-hydrolyzing) [Chloroflexi bacterium]|nr:asparagine synthase (glutamine-hydrolyzing) [Chloroflexota bacterium]